MKSKLFSRYDLIASDDFVKDMKRFLDLEIHAFKQIPKFTLSIISAPSEQESSKVLDDASEVLGLPRSHAASALSVSQFFLREFSSIGNAKEDNPIDIVTDIQDLLKLTEQKKQSLVEFLDEIKALSGKQGGMLLLRKSYARANLPNLESVSITVDFRVVFDKHFIHGDDLPSFSPKCLGTIPLGTISLKLSNRKEEVLFQADKISIRRLISNLQALEKEMDIAQSYLNLSEVIPNGT